VASALGTPTSFAFGGGSTFEGDAGNPQSTVPNGGVYVLKGGAATKLAGSPQYVAGLAWHQKACTSAAATCSPTATPASSS
jgi:hypothetical protein